jgi:hypothetical protein
MTDTAFDRAAITEFRFLRWEFDPRTGVARLLYAFDQGPGAGGNDPLPGRALPARARAPRRRRACAAPAAPDRWRQLLQGRCAAAPGHRPAARTGAAGAADRGLRTGPGRVRLPQRPAAARQAAIPVHCRRRRARPGALLGLPARALVAIGGGKDSLVSIEALRRAGIDQTVSWIGSAPLIRACAERTGLPMLNIERKLAPSCSSSTSRARSTAISRSPR